MKSFALLCVLFPLVASAQEVAVPDAPVVATVTSYVITSFTVQSDPDYRMRIEYRDSNGKTYSDEHFGPEKIIDATGQPIDNPQSAQSLIRSLNTANFSTTSLIKRLYQHLATHGKIPPSTVSGTPGPPIPK